MLVDYVTGKEITATPEEVEATQPFSRQLVEDYGYPKNLIKTHPQHRVQARPSSTNQSYPVDIAVMTLRDSIESAHIIVECKKKNRNDGIKQLHLYMGMSEAELGVWFNGEQRAYYRKIVKKSGTEFLEIPNIPKYGERVEDLGRFKRKDLSTPSQLGTVFHTLRNRLAANNVGVARDEALARQLINLIFCKIYDEKFTKPDQQVSFRAGIDESAASVFARISQLFERVLSSYATVFDKTDTLDLDQNSVLAVVGELQQYCLLDASRDAIAEAFEVFVGKALKGENGQFFTPRSVVELVVKILNPPKDVKILDPACGSGGFLIECMRYIWAQIERDGEELGWSAAQIDAEKTKAASTNIFGIDKDGFLAKVTKAYMTLVGDGTAGIACANSLEVPSNWSTETRNNVKLDEFDLVVTNPPFGNKKLKVEGRELLEQYDLAHNWKTGRKSGKPEIQSTCRTHVAPQILFIERCLQLLKDSGTLAIVLPETDLHAPSREYLREWLSTHCRVIAVVDLPHNTFRPYCNAKTCVLVVRKGEQASGTDQVILAEAIQMGHDHNGKPMVRPGTTEVWNDLPKIGSELDIAHAEDNEFVFTVPWRDIELQGHLVPRYYATKRKRLSAPKGCRWVLLGDLVDQGIIQAWDGHGSPDAVEKGEGQIPYIRVADIVNWELYRNPTSGVNEATYQRLTSNKPSVEPGDVIFVRRGSYRIGTVAMASPRDRKVLMTRELLTLRVTQSNEYGITPHYLMALLSSNNVQNQMRGLTFIDTTLPNIGSRWRELRLPVHKNHEQSRHISDKVKEAIDQKWAAQDEIESVRHEIGGLVT